MLDWNDLSYYRENNRLEAKKALGGLPRSIWETYSAFANTDGGLILLGVVEQPESKSFAPAGLPDAAQLAADFWNTLHTPGLVSVQLLREQDVAVIDVDGREIVSITVPRATAADTPVYIGPSPFGGTYLRRGEGDYRCTASEVQQMLSDADPTGPALRRRCRKDQITAFLVLCPQAEAWEIAQAVGLGLRQTLRYLRQLRQAGTVSLQRRHQKCYYYLTF